MGAPIVLTGLGANDPVPGNYVEVNFAQGPASGGQTARPILLIGNKSTAGSATAATIYGPTSTSLAPLANVTDAINLFGQGSELHRMYKRAVAVNTVTPIYAIAVAESAGAAATGAITIATTAAANGVARVWVDDEFVDTPITNGDPIATIASNIASAVNSKLDWAFTASASLGVATLTCKNKGLRGNFHTFSCQIIGPPSIGTTSSATTSAFTSGGTTADDNTAALAAIINSRYYYIVSAANDATQLGAVASQVGTQALPTNGLRQRVFAGSNDTSANVITLATGVNSARAEIVWLQDCDVPPAEMAANAAGLYALFESQTVPRLSWVWFGQSANDAPLWKIKAPRKGTIPTRAQIYSLLNSGVSPIGVLPTGQTYLVDRITTRSLSGSTPDYRTRDAHKVTVCDFFADDWVVKSNLQFVGKLIADDPVQGQRVPGGNVVTPRVVKAGLWALIDDYASNDLIQNAAQVKAGVITQRETSPTTRIAGRVPMQPADVYKQGAFAIDQVA